MTKPTPLPFPAIENVRFRIRFKMFVPSGNTGGTIIVGLADLSPTVPQMDSATQVAINLDNYTKGTWHDIDYSFDGSVVSGSIFRGAVAMSNTDRVTGADVWIAAWHVTESRGDSPAIPQKVQSSAYTIQLPDLGRHIYISTGGVTIPLNSNVGLPVDFVVSIVNNSGSTQTISRTSGVTLYKAGSGTAVASVTLAARGIATVLKVASDTWIISGSVS